MAAAERHAEKTADMHLSDAAMSGWSKTLTVLCGKSAIMEVSEALRCICVHS